MPKRFYTVENKDDSALGNLRMDFITKHVAIYSLDKISGRNIEQNRVIHRIIYI